MLALPAVHVPSTERWSRLAPTGIDAGHHAAALGGAPPCHPVAHAGRYAGHGIPCLEMVRASALPAGSPGSFVSSFPAPGLSGRGIRPCGCATSAHTRTVPAVDRWPPG